MKLVDGPYTVREKDREEKARTHRVLKPALIEDPQSGDVFITIN